MKNSTFATILLVLCSLSGGADQAPQSVAEILTSSERPTMTTISQISHEFAEELGIPSAPLRVGNGHVLDFQKWTKILLENGPQLIANLEKTNPGATWAFIGRDTQAIADLFEGFYLSIGQKNRVQRIFVSKASFQKTSTNSLVGVLESNGFSLNRFQDSHPYILVDTVSSGGGRQGRSILAAAYKIYGERGGKMSDLVRKLNMIGLYVSTFQGTPTPLENYNNLLTEEELSFYISDPLLPNESLEEYFRIAGYSETNHLSNETGYEHFTGAWTGSYGQIKEDQFGKFRATPGADSDVTMRKNILWMQNTIWKTVSSPEFLEKVKEEAQKIKFDFPVKRPIPAKFQFSIDKVDDYILSIVAQNTKNFVDPFWENSPQIENALRFFAMQNFISAAQEMTMAQDATQQLSENAADMWRYFPVSSHPQDPDSFPVSIRLLRQAYVNKHLITKWDLKWILIYTLGHARLTEPLAEELKLLAKESRTAARLLKFEQLNIVPPVVGVRQFDNNHLQRVRNFVKMLNHYHEAKKKNSCETVLEGAGA